MAAFLAGLAIGKVVAELAQNVAGKMLVRNLERSLR